MFNLFKKKETEKKNNLSLLSVASLLIHAAKIDQNFTDKENEIIHKSLIEMGADEKDIFKIMKEAKEIEKDSNQILNFTREIKNVSEHEKKLIIESLWNIIYSDKNADTYENNLMRRLSGLLYLDNKIVGDIKEKVRLKKQWLI